MRAVAFFDFDGTITTNDTFITFGKFSLGKIRFIRKIIKASPWLMLWKLRIISNSRAKEILFSFMFKGMSEKTFLRLCQDFRPIIDKSLRSSTLEYIEQHRQQGHRIVIVSASIKSWIEPWAKSHGIDDILATEAEFDTSNCLTGRFSTPNCHGPEKVNRIKQLLGDISGLETYAYGDSNGDNAMLDSVKHPVRII